MAETIHIRKQLRDRPEFKNMPKPLTCGEDATVQEAVDAMCAKGFGCIVMVDDDQKVLGILSERDLMTRLLKNQMDPNTTKVSEIMTRDPYTAHETDLVVDCLRLMSNKRFRRLPVVDENDRLARVFTQGDFVSYTWPDMLHDMAESTKKSVERNYPLWMLAGGVVVYSLIMSILVVVLVS
ncbi:MAG: CBS domain-containing protein [Natronospirillum sp.]|uniref:CBS domain-containing protein n=1 Tax=Natronospirillum sp. TaxID=2812955 RepID=UPI0025EB3DBD|nr:CBS domain-containing protein [Natronospirillum sp.]MCH8552784.1 CBS domain-containing protein [Natronospirillum sp.]